MPVLVSTIYWTPFFWGQNYYGMLWPWVFSPVHHVLANFLFNNGAVLFTGVAVHFAVAFYIFRRRAAYSLGAVNLIALLTLTGTSYCYDNLGPALFFTTPLLLGIVALYLLEQSRHVALTALSLAMLSAASWMNVSIPVSLAVLTVTPAAFWQSLREARQSWSGASAALAPVGWWRVFPHMWRHAFGLRQIVLLSVAAQSGLLLMHQTPFPGPTQDVLPWPQWPGAVMATAVVGWRGVGYVAGIAPAPLLFGLCLFVGGITWRVRRDGQTPWAACCRGVLLAMAAACFTSIHTWAHANSFAIRYWYPELLIIEICLLGAAVLPWLSGLRRWRALEGSATVMVLAAIIGQFGLPAWSNPTQDLTNLAGPLAEQAVQHQADAIAGNYWRVWPAVLVANMRLQGAGQPAHIVGLTYRGSQALQGLPKPTRPLRVVAAPGDREAASWCRMAGLRVVSGEMPDAATDAAQWLRCAPSPQ